jgi:hypothetical protein
MRGTQYIAAHVASQGLEIRKRCHAFFVGRKNSPVKQPLRSESAAAANRRLRRPRQSRVRLRSYTTTMSTAFAPNRAKSRRICHRTRIPCATRKSTPRTAARRRRRRGRGSEGFCGQYSRQGAADGNEDAILPNSHCIPAKCCWSWLHRLCTRPRSVTA